MKTLSNGIIEETYSNNYDYKDYSFYVFFSFSISFYYDYYCYHHYCHCYHSYWLAAEIGRPRLGIATSMANDCELL